MEGKHKICLMHLGGLIDCHGSSQPEVHARLKAANVGWCRLGQYWYSRSPRRAKRAVFLAHVAGRAWSGLEAYILTRRQEAAKPQC